MNMIKQSLMSTSICTNAMRNKNLAACDWILMGLTRFLCDLYIPFILSILSKKRNASTINYRKF